MFTNVYQVPGNGRVYVGTGDWPSRQLARSAANRSNAITGHVRIGVMRPKGKLNG
jgi:hypothetical protein